MKKTKGNTEIFQEMIKTAMVVSKDLKLRVDMDDFPLLNKKSRSFKEIAECLLHQMCFLLERNCICEMKPMVIQEND